MTLLSPWSSFTCRLAMAAALLLCATSSYAQTSAAVITTPVAEQSISEVITAYGLLIPDPAYLINMSLSHAGQVNQVWVRSGQRVQKGQKLIELITAPEARMQYIQAQSAVELAKKQLARSQRLLKSQLVTQGNLDSAYSNLNDAKASLNALKQKNVDKSSEILRSPVDGVITQLSVSQGQRVSINTNAVLIAANNRLIAQLGIEPKQVNQLTVKLPVTITAVFDSKSESDSEISNINSMLNVNTHLVDIFSHIPEEQSHLFVLGENVKASIRAETHVGLVVPRSAVLTTNGKAYVFKNVNNIAVKIGVEVGVEQEKLTEVIGDLTVGDNVVSTGNYVLTDGMALRGAL
jgi:RND family efflux transporter MFP subunit